MTAAVRGTEAGRRRSATRLGLVTAVVVLVGLLSPEPRADRRATEPAPQPPQPVQSEPVTAVPRAGGPTFGPAVTVDLAPSGTPAEAALDVAGTGQGGAAVILGVGPQGRVRRLVTVSAGGERTGSFGVPGMTSAWNLHLLPNGTALVTGRLDDEDAVGYAMLDPRTGAARTVAALPLDPAAQGVVGGSAVSSDGRTVWLFSSMLVGDRFSYGLTGHDLTTGGLVARRDMSADLQPVQANYQQLDLIGLGSRPDGGVVLAANVFPPANGSLWRPVLLVYDAGLDPLSSPLPLPSDSPSVTARAFTTAPDGTAFVLLRGSPTSSLVALPPGDRRPELRLRVAGFGFTDELVIDARGRAVLPSDGGVRTIDLATGATTDVDLGCAGIVTVRGLAKSAATGTWVLGGCFEEGVLSSVLWRIP